MRCLCTCFSSNFDVLHRFPLGWPTIVSIWRIEYRRNSRVSSLVRSSRLILSVMTSRSAPIVHDCGAELFTRIGGEGQVLFQISSEHCPGICACVQCWKSTFMLPQNWNNMQATARKPWRSSFFFSQVHMISGSRRSSNLPGLPLGKTQNTRTQLENLAGGTDKYVCSCDNTADSSTEETAKNAVPDQSPTLLLSGFPTSAHSKSHHFAPGNNTHQSQDKGSFVRTLDNVDLFFMVTVLVLT